MSNNTAELSARGEALTLVYQFISRCCPANVVFWWDSLYAISIADGSYCILTIRIMYVKLRRMININL